MDSPALNAALHLLKFRVRSCKELKNRLNQKGFTHSEIKETLEYLKDLGYVNDKEFAFLFVKDKIKQKGAGPIYLKTELLKHNIPDELIREAMSLGYSKYSQDELITNHIVKRKNILSDENILTQKRKIIQFLQRKGFTWEQISPQLNKTFPD